MYELDDTHKEQAIKAGSLRNTKLAEVAAEMVRQDTKWGALRQHDPLQWLAILTEETGEVAKSVVDGHFSKDYVPATLNYQHAAHELIQVAAVAIQAAISIDLQYGKKKD